MSVPDKRRQKRLLKGNRKTAKEMEKVVQETVQQIDVEERRRAAQAIIDRVMRSLVQ
jgi:hypothetical protein